MQEIIQTCIILAGVTFNFVHESLIMCTSFSCGTILANTQLALSHSHFYISVTALH